MNCWFCGCEHAKRKLGCSKAIDSAQIRGESPLTGSCPKLVGAAVSAETDQGKLGASLRRLVHTNCPRLQEQEFLEIGDPDNQSQLKDTLRRVMRSTLLRRATYA